jgi:hypothetical protein
MWRKSRRSIRAARIPMFVRNREAITRADVCTPCHRCEQRRVGGYLLSIALASGSSLTSIFLT